MAGTATISWIGNPAAAGPTISSFDTKTGTGQLTHTLSGVPNGATLVLSIAGSDATNNATIGGSPTLTWTKQVDASLSNSGDAEIWTADAGAGGSISITVQISNNLNSSVCYVITGEEAVLGGTSNSATNQSLPSVAVTTTRANSLLICVSSDFHAVDGASRVYLDGAVEKLYHFLASNYTAYHYVKQTTSIATYTEGLSAPSTQQAGTCVYEIRVP